MFIGSESFCAPVAALQLVIFSPIVRYERKLDLSSKQRAFFPGRFLQNQMVFSYFVGRNAMTAIETKSCRKGTQIPNDGNISFHFVYLFPKLFQCKIIYVRIHYLIAQ